MTRSALLSLAACLLWSASPAAWAEDLGREGDVTDAVAAPAAAVPPAVAAPQTMEQLWAEAGADAVLADAVERRRLGDFEGADARFSWLEAHGGGPEVQYHRALSMEFQERYAEAEAAYAQVAESAPGAAVARDARFRRALCLEDMGRHREALRLVKALKREGGWSDRDRLSLELAQGVTALRDGRTRRGVRRIQAALDEAAAFDDLTWMRAKAHTALGRYLLAAASGIQQTNGRTAGKRLQQRAAHISNAEQQVIAVARLGEPEYALEGLLLLGDAYLGFHDDLLAAPAPRSLTPEQQALYEQALVEKVSVLKRKAWRYYDEGVALATRTRWSGAVASELRSRRDGLDL